MRLFVAVGLPKEVLDEAARIQGLLKGFKLRFVRPELMHITLVFLGEMSDSAVTHIREHLRKVKHKGFDAKISGFGVFPNWNSVRVIWMGAEGPFDELFKEVSTTLVHHGSQQFSSHITLARLKFAPDKKALSEALHNIKPNPISFHVGSFKLMQSVLELTGPVYSTIEEFKLE